jgi:hypothetical protein
MMKYTLFCKNVIQYPNTPKAPNGFAQAEARKIAKKEASRLDRHGGLIKDESRG